MTPEERFERIEVNLERIIARMDALEVAREVDRHQFNERVNKLWEAHTVLMDSQNHTWEAIRLIASNVDKLSIKVDQLSINVDKLTINVDKLTINVDKLTINVDKLSDTVDRLVQGLQKPNGQG